MTRIFSANALARTFGNETFARAVFDGPVFRKAKKIAAKISHHAAGNGVNNMSAKSGNAITIPRPDTRKYAPGFRLRSRSAIQPPSSVEINPATTRMAPKIALPEAAG